jgi:hypothetical protein
LVKSFFQPSRSPGCCVLLCHISPAFNAPGTHGFPSETRLFATTRRLLRAHRRVLNRAQWQPYTRHLPRLANPRFSLVVALSSCEVPSCILVRCISCRQSNASILLNIVMRPISYISLFRHVTSRRASISFQPLYTQDPASDCHGARFILWTGDIAGKRRSIHAVGGGRMKVTRTASLGVFDG